MEIHEFYLDGLNLPTNAPRIYRVALGQLIPAHERNVFPPEWPSPYRRSMSGSIGFMDVTRQEQHLPTKSARRDEWGCWDSHKTQETLAIFDIGIEPAHRGKEYFRWLLRRAENLACSWQLNTIIGEMVLNQRLHYVLCKKFGYLPLDDNLRVFKHLSP